MTSERFNSFLKKELPFEMHLLKKDTDAKKQSSFIQYHLNHTLNPNFCSPIQYDYFEQTLHIPLEKEQFSSVQEILTHYLLLYNLSMIARYETEWWSELFHGFDSLDYPFIDQFLSVTTVKIPYLINLYLQVKFK